MMPPGCSDFQSAFGPFLTFDIHEIPVALIRGNFAGLYIRQQTRTGKMLNNLPQRFGGNDTCASDPSSLRATSRRTNNAPILLRSRNSSWQRALDRHQMTIEREFSQCHDISD